MTQRSRLRGGVQALWACVFAAGIGCGADGAAERSDVATDVRIDAAPASDAGPLPDGSHDGAEGADGDSAYDAESDRIAAADGAATRDGAGREPDADTDDASASDTTDDGQADGSDAGSDGGDTPAGDSQTPPTCGNGVVEPPERCDDGNAVDGNAVPGSPTDWCSADCSTLIDVSEATSHAVRRSYFQLPTSNGIWAAVFDASPAQRRLTTLREEIYAAYDQGEVSRDVLWDAYFGFSTGAPTAQSWLVSTPLDESGYVEGTNVIRVVQTRGAAKLVQHTFAPFFHPSQGYADARLLVSTLRVENAGAEPMADATVWALWNLHMGGQGVYDQEQATPGAAPGSIVERRGDAVAVVRSLAPEQTSLAAGPAGAASNPWTIVASGGDFVGFEATGLTSDVALGLRTRFAEPLAPGEAREAGFVLAYGRGAAVTAEALQAQIDAYVAGRAAEALRADEEAWWQSWHAAEALPETLSDKERALARQAAVVLKMGQSRQTPATGCASDRCFGQILASLPPGQWNIAWVRDAAYAIVGLVKAGHMAEAKDALRFFANAEMRPSPSGGNYYQKQFIESADASAGVWGLGRSLGEDYAISVTRYFGRGLEESDDNAAGPNIEWDNWGLFLWALGEYVEAADDDAFAAEMWPTAGPRTADVLLNLTDAETGLLLPDSSIWERHWCPHGQCDEPETRKRHAYSAIAAVRGLQSAAQIAARVGKPERAAAYVARAESLAQAIRGQLVVEVPTTGLPAVAGNVEELPFDVYYLDLASVEAINWGVVPPGSVEAFGTFAAFDEHLRVGPHSPGYIRNDDPTWYDRQEWVVMDLRAAAALAAMGQRNRAQTLVDWVAEQASANAYIMAELLSDGVYSPGSEDEQFDPGHDPGGDYQGAIPMVGFGAGAYLLALEALGSIQE